jgi:hypothetical protein
VPAGEDDSKVAGLVMIRVASSFGDIMSDGLIEVFIDGLRSKAPDVSLGDAQPSMPNICRPTRQKKEPLLPPL